MSPIERIEGSPKERKDFLDGLRGVLDDLRSDPLHGQHVRRFEEILNIIRREEEGRHTGMNPIEAARLELRQAGKWMSVSELCQLLDKKDVQAPATRNRHQSAGKRRSLVNSERLVRIILQGINYGKFIGFKKEESALMVTYVGLTDWQDRIPPKVQVIEPKPKTKRRK